MPQCNQNEVLLKVEATAVNRADTLQRKGKYPPPKGVTDIIGLECVGFKTDPLTLQVDKSQQYMALLSGGSYALYAKVHKDHLIPVPKSLKLEQIAAIPEVWLTAYQLLHLVGNSKPKETALVLAAASGVGTSLIQLAKKHDMKVIAVASTHEKLKICKELGTDLTISYKENPDYSLVVQEYTKKQGANVILDPILASNFEFNMNSLAVDGQWVMYGTMGGLKVENANFTKLILKRGNIIASTLRNRSDEYKTELIQRFIKDCIQDFESGKLKPIVDRVMKLSEVQEAHRIIENNANIGKIVLINDL
eukprot:403339393